MKRKYILHIDTDEKRCWQKATQRLQKQAIYELLMETPMRWVELKRALKLHRSTLSALLSDMILDELIQKQYSKEKDCIVYVLVNHST